MPNGLGLPASIRRFERLAGDRTPRRFLTPFQREDLASRIETAAEQRRGQQERAITARTRDTGSPAFQQQQAALTEGVAGAAGRNIADLELEDFRLGEAQKQAQLRNLERTIAIKQAEKARRDAQEAAEGGDEEGGTSGIGQSLGAIGGAALGSFFGPAGTAAGASLGAGLGEAAEGGATGAQADPAGAAIKGGISAVVPGGPATAAVPGAASQIVPGVGSGAPPATVPTQPGGRVINAAIRPGGTASNQADFITRFLSQFGFAGA